MATVVDITADSSVKTAARLLAAGAVVAVPTDTVYGLVCRFDNDEAIRRIFTIKGRPPSVPLPVLVADIKQTHLIAPELPEAAIMLAGQFWPGPLTIVVHAHSGLSPIITGGLHTVGMRAPSQPQLLQLLKMTGPLASTSANRHGEPPARSAADVEAAFTASIDLILDGGRSNGSGVSSTVVDVTVEPVRVLREGAISQTAIRAWLSGTR